MNKFFFILIQIILAYIIADIVTGFFHWFEDTYLEYCINIPILSKIAKDNELHHYFPRTIVHCTYLQNISVVLPLVLITFIIIYIINKKLLFRYKYFFIIFFVLVLLSNIIHKFSHMRTCELSPFIINLQKTGLLCSHKHHKIHHISANEKYCVISEYNNYILDYINFWRNLEYIIYISTNIKPKQKLSYDGYYEIQNHLHKNAKLPCPKKPTKEDIIFLKNELIKYKKCNY